MNIEEKAKAYDEALDRCKEWASGILGHSVDDSPKDIAEFIFPHLAESEDERIRKALIWHLKADTDFVSNGVTKTECIAWLEKQKEPENTSASTMIPSCWEIEQKSAECSEDERIRKDIIALIKFGLNDGSAVSPGSHTTKEEALAYLEKQKDASKAIEAVEKIDKYIDEHLANAHDMKDSNPDKKYYRGWDDALGKMAGILQDVYSGEKQKEQNYVVTHGETYRVDTLGTQQVIAGKMPQKPAEWSDEDSRMLSDIAGYISGVGSSSGITKRERVDFLYELPKRFNLQPKQNWSEEDKKKINFLSRLIEFQVKDDEYCSSDGRFISKQEAIEMLKSLRPQLKSEWSEDIIRKAVKEIGLTQHQIDWFKDNVFPSKVEWSEEDEGELQNAIDALEFLGKKGVYKSESGYDAALQAASWLKALPLSLKKRNEDVTKLCSNEWSEEDEEIFNNIIEKAKGGHWIEVNEITWLIAWFKSLRPVKQE